MRWVLFKRHWIWLVQVKYRGSEGYELLILWKYDSIVAKEVISLCVDCSVVFLQPCPDRWKRIVLGGVSSRWRGDNISLVLSYLTWVEVCLVRLRISDQEGCRRVCSRASESSSFVVATEVWVLRCWIITACLTCLFFFLDSEAAVCSLRSYTSYCVYMWSSPVVGTFGESRLLHCYLSLEVV